jgi:hypothetical protein
MWQQITVQKCISNDKYATYLSNGDKSGDRKEFAATIVANVATVRTWLDTTDLEQQFFLTVFCFAIFT